jgi:hypothetical protein
MAMPDREIKRNRYLEDEVREHNNLARAISSSFAVIAIVTLDPAFYLNPPPSLPRRGARSDGPG